MIFLLQLLLPVQSFAASRLHIALQPLGKIDNKILLRVKAGVQKVYGDVNIDIRPQIKLPQSAYYKPRQRYRAEKLLYYLQNYYQYNGISRYNKIIGLTAKDISATKGKYYDWGIFGYAFLDSEPGVVSTFRLKRNAKSYSIFMDRVIKCVVHELGHTLGFPHCPYKGCIMQDAKGTIKTVDAEDGSFCRHCKPKLNAILKRFRIK
jgi:archaemetzincin